MLLSSALYMGMNKEKLMTDEKREKITNICFIVVVIIMALLVVKMIWGQEIAIKKVPIRDIIETRFAKEIDDATMTDTAIKKEKQKIIEEEIESNIVKIPIIDIDTIEIDISDLAVDEIRTIIFYLGQVVVSGSVQYRDGKITVVEKKNDMVFWKWSK